MFEIVEDAVVYLAQEHGVSVIMAKNGDEMYEYLHTVSRTLAESVYRKKAHELDCVTRRKMQTKAADDETAGSVEVEDMPALPGGKSKSEVTIL